MNLQYHLVDVFTDRAFGGNPLAVFPDGRDLTAALMQSIAKELNLSETTFVLPPDDRGNDFHVRIFTPTIEMPMAGHPTIGTAYVLAHERMVPPWDQTTKLKFEERVGVIPVTINGTHGHPEFIEMGQPMPEFGQPIDDVSLIAEMLSLDSESIRSTQLPVETVSCGVPFLLVPVIDLAAIRRIRLRLEICERVRDQVQTPNVFVFTREVEQAGSQTHSRMFAPSLGVVEDPATGSASGPFGLLPGPASGSSFRWRAAVRQRTGLRDGPAQFHQHPDSTSG